MLYKYNFTLIVIYDIKLYIFFKFLYFFIKLHKCFPKLAKFLLEHSYSKGVKEKGVKSTKWLSEISR